MKDANHVKHGKKNGGKQWKHGGTLSWKPSKHEAKTRSKKLGTIPWTLGTPPTPRQYLFVKVWEVFSGLCINGNVCVSYLFLQNAKSACTTLRLPFSTFALWFQAYHLNHQCHTFLCLSHLAHGHLRKFISLHIQVHQVRHESHRRLDQCILLFYVPRLYALLAAQRKSRTLWIHCDSNKMNTWNHMKSHEPQVWTTESQWCLVSPSFCWFWSQRHHWCQSKLKMQSFQSFQDYSMFLLKASLHVFFFVVFEFLSLTDRDVPHDRLRCRRGWWVGSRVLWNSRICVTMAMFFVCLEDTLQIFSFCCLYLFYHFSQCFEMWFARWIIVCCCRYWMISFNVLLLSCLSFGRFCQSIFVIVWFGLVLSVRALLNLYQCRLPLIGFGNVLVLVLFHFIFPKRKLQRACLRLLDPTDRHGIFDSSWIYVWTSSGLDVKHNFN